jgi:hypothetical protein
MEPSKKSDWLGGFDDEGRYIIGDKEDFKAKNLHRVYSPSTISSKSLPEGMTLKDLGYPDPEDKAAPPAPPDDPRNKKDLPYPVPVADQQALLAEGFREKERVPFFDRQTTAGIIADAEDAEPPEFGDVGFVFKALGDLVDMAPGAAIKTGQALVEPAKEYLKWYVTSPLSPAGLTRRMAVHGAVTGVTPSYENVITEEERTKIAQEPEYGGPVLRAPRPRQDTTEEWIETGTPSERQGRVFDPNQVTEQEAQKFLSKYLNDALASGAITQSEYDATLDDIETPYDVREALGKLLYRLEEIDPESNSFSRAIDTALRWFDESSTSLLVTLEANDKAGAYLDLDAATDPNNNVIQRGGLEAVQELVAKRRAEEDPRYAYAIPEWLETVAVPAYTPGDYAIDIPIGLTAAGLIGVFSGGMAAATAAGATAHTVLKAAGLPVRQGLSRMLRNLMDERFSAAALAQIRQDTARIAARKATNQRAKVDTLERKLNTRAEPDTPAIVDAKDRVRVLRRKAEETEKQAAKSLASATESLVAERNKLRLAKIPDTTARAAELAGRNIGASLGFTMINNSLHSGASELPEGEQSFWQTMLKSMALAGGMIRLKNVAQGNILALENMPRYTAEGKSYAGLSDAMAQNISRKPNIFSRVLGGTAAQYAKENRRDPKLVNSVLSKLGLLDPDAPKFTGRDVARYNVLMGMREFDLGVRVSDQPSATAGVDLTLGANQEQPFFAPPTDRLGGAILHREVAQVLDYLPNLESTKFNIDEYIQAYKDLLQYGDETFYNSTRKSLSDLLEQDLSESARSQTNAYIDSIDILHKTIKRVRKLEATSGVKLLPEQLDDSMVRFLRDRHSFIHQTDDAGVGYVSLNRKDSPDLELSASSGQEVGGSKSPPRQRASFHQEGELSKVGDEAAINFGKDRVVLRLTDQGVESVLERSTPVSPSARLNEIFLGDLTKEEISEGLVKEGAELTGFLLDAINRVSRTAGKDSRGRFRTRTAPADTNVSPEVAELVNQIVTMGADQTPTAPKKPYRVGSETRQKNVRRSKKFFADVKTAPQRVLDILRYDNPSATLTPYDEAYITAVAKISSAPAVKGKYSPFNRTKPFYQLLSKFNELPEKTYKPIGVPELLVPGQKPRVGATVRAGYKDQAGLSEFLSDPTREAFLDTVAKDAMRKLREAKNKKLPVLKKPEGSTVRQIFDDPVRVEKNVTIPRGTVDASRNVELLGGKEVSLDDVPPILFSVSLFGIPKAINASRRKAGGADSHIPLFTSEGEASIFAMAFQNAIAIARKEAGIAGDAGVNAVEAVLKNQPVKEKTFNAVVDSMQQLYDSIIADRHMGLIPDSIWTPENMSKWFGEDAANFWAKHDYSPTEVYKEYLRERNAAAGVSGSTVTLSKETLAQRKFADVNVSRVNRGDIPQAALVVGEIPGSQNNVRVFAEKLRPDPYLVGDDLPVYMRVAQLPVNRLGQRVLPRSVEIELFRPLNNLEITGRSPGIGLTEEQRKVESMPDTVENPVLEGGPPDEPGTGKPQPYDPYKRWSSRYLEMRGDTVVRELDEVFFNTRGMDNPDKMAWKLLYDQEWSLDVENWVNEVVSRQNPFFYVSTGAKGYLEIIQGQTPVKVDVGPVEFTTEVDGFTGRKITRTQPKTVDRELPHTGEILPVKLHGRGLPSKTGGVQEINKMPVRYLWESDGATHVFASKQDLNDWVDTLDISPARKSAVAQRIMLSNLYNHLTRKGSGAGVIGMTAGRAKDWFNTSFNLQRKTPESAAAANIIQAIQGVHRAIETEIYNVQIAKETFANTLGKNTVRELNESWDEMLKLNPESAYDVTKIGGKDSPARKMQLQQLNAYLYGTPEHQFRDGAVSLMERGITPPDPPSTARKIEAGEELGPNDLTGKEIEIINDVLHDVYMERAISDIVDTLHFLPEEQRKNALNFLYENYIPRIYDMDLTRKIFGEFQKTGETPFGTGVFTDENLFQNAGEVIGTRLQTNPFSPSTPSEQALRDSYIRFRSDSVSRTDFETLVKGKRRNSYEKLKNLGYDPEKFGFLFKGSDNISNMVERGFIPVTNNLVEMYQFKKYEVDRHVLRKRMLNLMVEGGVIQKINHPDLLKIEKGLQDLGMSGSLLNNRFRIVAMSEELAAKENVKASERQNEIGRFMDVEYTDRLKGDEILIAGVDTFELIERWVRPGADIAEDASNVFQRSGIEAWRETNNILQNYQLGFGFFHLGTMFSESMGSSLEAAGTAAANVLKAGKGMPAVPTGKFDASGKPILEKVPGTPAVPVLSWILGRLGKGVAFGLGPVRDTAHLAGLTKKDFDLWLAHFTGKEKPTRGKNPYPVARSFPIQVAASLFAFAKRNSLLEKKAQQLASNIDKLINRSKKVSEGGYDPYHYFRTPIMRPGKTLISEDQSLGALMDALTLNSVPSKDIDPTTKYIIMQQILGNFQRPSEKYGQSYMRNIMQKGENELTNYLDVWSRSPDAKAMTEKSRNKVMQSMRSAANFTIHQSAWMFDHMIPQAKNAAFMERMRVELMRLGPDATPGQVRRRAQHIQDSIDNRFGMVQYDNLFWNKKFRQMMHLIVRSVGWNMGTLKEVLVGGPMDFAKYVGLKGLRGVDAAAGLPKGQRTKQLGSIDDWSTRAGYSAALIPWKIMQGVMLEYLLTGLSNGWDKATTPLDRVDFSDFTEDPYRTLVENLAEFIAPRDGQVDSYGNPTRMLPPDYAKDVGKVHLSFAQGGITGLAKELGTMTINKLSPMARLMADAYIVYAGSNKDYFGAEYSSANGPFGKALDIATTNFKPFALGTMWHQFDRQNQPLSFMALSFMFGFTPANSAFLTTPAEKKMQTSYNLFTGDRPAIGTQEAAEKRIYDLAGEAIRTDLRSRDPKRIRKAVDLLRDKVLALDPEMQNKVAILLPEYFVPDFSATEMVIWRMIKNNNLNFGSPSFLNNRAILANSLRESFGVDADRFNNMFAKVLEKMGEVGQGNFSVYDKKATGFNDFFKNPEMNVINKSEVLQTMSDEELAISILNANNMATEQEVEDTHNGTLNYGTDENRMDHKFFPYLAGPAEPQTGGDTFDPSVPSQVRREVLAEWLMEWSTKKNDVIPKAILFEKVFVNGEYVTNEDIAAADLSPKWEEAVRGHMKTMETIRKHAQ